MTALKRIFLKCNSCNNLASLVGSESVGEARNDARKLGWRHTKDGRDLCAHCGRQSGYPVVPHQRSPR